MNSLKMSQTGVKNRTKQARKREIVQIPASNIRSTRIPGPGDRHVVETFTRWIDGGSVYPQTGGIGAGASFRLSQIPGNSEITAMYDFFRLSQVDVCYYPASKAGPTSATTNSSGGVMAGCVDYDENTANSFLALQERQDCQIFSVYDRWQVTFEPRASVQVYANGVTSAYALAQKGEWMDTSSDPSYYGFVTAFPATSSNLQFGGRLMYRVTIQVAKVI